MPTPQVEPPAGTPFDEPMAGIADPVARAAAWSEALSPLFDRAGPADRDPGWAGLVRHRRLGRTLVGEVTAGGAGLERSEGLALRQGFDHLMVLACVAGSAHLRERDVSIGPGACLVLDLSQPLRLDLVQANLRTIVLPRARAAALGAHPANLPARAVASAGLPHLFTLLADLDRLCIPGGAPSAALAQAVEGLAVACLPLDPDSPDKPAVAGVAPLVRRHIEENIGAPDLGVDALALRFGVSRATLYRLFAAEGGVAQYVRRRRLALALRRLGDPGGRPRISQLAYGLGFEDEKSFSRAFKRAFGVSPREFAGGAGAAPGYGRGATLMGWLQALG